MPDRTFNRAALQPGRPFYFFCLSVSRACSRAYASWLPYRSQRSPTPVRSIAIKANTSQIRPNLKFLRSNSRVPRQPCEGYSPDHNIWYCTGKPLIAWAKLDVFSHHSPVASLGKHHRAA